MADSLVPKTFLNMIEIVEGRAKIAGEIQSSNRVIIKAALNECNQRVSTERAWYWTKFDRAQVIAPPITTGTANLIQGSREVELTGLDVSMSFLSKSIRFNNTPELYRIIGVSVNLNKIYLEAAWVNNSDTAATYKIYEYEFALPPDCQKVNQITIDDFVNSNNDSNSGELDAIDVLRFNRLLTNHSNYIGLPSHYNIEGKHFTFNYPDLDEMILNYDFLNGDIEDQQDKLRIFPIAPHKNTLLHINYSKKVQPLVNDDDEPLIPLDKRWLMIHYALAVWNTTNGSPTLASESKKEYKDILKEMREDHRKTDQKPRLIVNHARFRREHHLNFYGRFYRNFYNN